MVNDAENPIRIVILEAHMLIRSGFRLIIETQPDMKVVGEAENSAAGIEVITQQQPDIILLRIDSSGNFGIDIVPSILKSWEKGRIIFMSSTGDKPNYLRAVQDGALGVVSIAQGPEILVKAIRKVYAGEVWIERSMLADLLTSISREKLGLASSPEANMISLLSRREREIIKLIGQGLKNQQIAAKLCLSETTVRNHLTSIYSKLGVSDRLELLIFSNRMGLV